MRQRKIVSVVSLISIIFGGYIDGIQRAKFGLLNTVIVTAGNFEP